MSVAIQSYSRSWAGPPLAVCFPAFETKKNPFQCQVVGYVFSVVPLAPQPRLGGPVVPYLTITVWAGSFGASGL